MAVSVPAPAGAREGRPPRLVEDAPALLSPDWLPPRGSGWEALDELGADHRRLLDQRGAIAAEHAELRRGFEREDEAARAELTAAYREGREAMAPDVTPPEERRAGLDALVQRMEATNDALDGFLTDAIERIQSEAVGWQADLAGRLSDAEAKRLEAQRLLAEAEVEELRVRRIEEWVLRNSGLHERRGFRAIPGFRYVGWDHLMANYNPPGESDDVRVVDPPSQEPWDAEQVARARAAAGMNSITSGRPIVPRTQTTEEEQS